MGDDTLRVDDDSTLRVDDDSTLRVNDDSTLLVSDEAPAGTATASGVVFAPGQTIVLNGKNCTIESKFSKNSGEAIVYKVKIDSKPYVLKHYKSDTPMSSNAKEIVTRIKNAPHDRIVKVIDFGKYDDRDYEILEFAEGGTLDEYIKAGAIRDEKRLKNIVKMVNEGLLQLHGEYNVIYQDLKPDNIFFKDARKTKAILADFGISSVMEADKKRAQVGMSQTKLYGAPELAVKPGEKYVIATPAADYYSLGVTMYEMWLGEYPFKNVKASELSNMIDEGNVDFPAEMPEDCKTLIFGLIKGRSERWGNKQIQQWLKGQPLEATGKAAQIYATEMFNDKESYSSPKELAALMAKYPEQGETILYSNIAAAWFEKAGRKLRAEEMKEIAATHAKDKQAGCYSAIYKIDPARPWDSKGGKSCTNSAEIAAALMAESAYYMEDLKKPNSRLYLYLTAVEGASGAGISDMFLKYFTESGHNPKYALALVCLGLQNRCVTIGAKKYSSPEELTQEQDNAQRDLIKKAVIETDSIVQVWLSEIYKINVNIKQSPVGMFTILGLLPYLQFKELAGSNWEQYAFTSLRTFITDYPGRSDFFETYAAQKLPLNKTLGANNQHKTPLDYIVSNFTSITAKHGEDTVLNLIQLLAKLGADVNAASGDGKSTLLNALEARNTMLIKTLVDLGADKESMNKAYKALSNKANKTDTDKKIMDLLNPSAITKLLLLPGKICKAILNFLIVPIFVAIAFIVKGIWSVITKILEVTDDVADGMEDNTSSVVFNVICTAGIAVGTWVLLERMFEQDFWVCIGAAAASVLGSWFLIKAFAFDGYGLIYRPVKVLAALILAIAGIVGFFTLSPPVKVIEPLTATVSAEALNMRSKPADAGAVVKTIKKGETLVITGNAIGNWMPVRFGETIGYANASSIHVTKQSATVTAKNLILRSGPFTNSASMKVLNKGDVLNVTGPSANGWTPVKIGTVAGYVDSYLVTIKNLPTVMTVTAGSLILYAGPSTTSTTIKHLKKDDVLLLAGSASNGWTPVFSGTTSGWVPSNSIAIKADPAATAAAAPQITAATVVSNSVSVYADKSPKTTLKTLKKGEAIIITGPAAGGWTPVRSGNVSGWVISSTVAAKK